MNKLMCHHTLKTVYLPLLTCLITIHANAMSDQLYIGETIYLNDPTVTDVVIGNDQIVKAKKVGNKGIALTGVATGDTTLKVWNGNRYFTSEIHVYPSNVKKTLEDLQVALRDIPKLSIKLVGDNVVLQAKDLTLEEKERIDGYASLFRNVANLTKTKENTLQEKQKMIYLDVRVV